MTHEAFDIGAANPPSPAQSEPKIGSRRRFNWQYAPAFVVVHAAALLAFLPWFFSWTGVVVFVLSCYVFGTLGITVCYHRLLTHRSFACPRWLERVLSVLGCCCVQDSPAYWVAIHRRHHQFSDEPQDPHSPLVSFFWGHMGWLLVKTDDMKPTRLIARYAKDIVRDPFQAWLERSDNWFKCVMISWLLYFGVGYGAIVLSGGSTAEAIQFGSSLLVWGAAVRIVYNWHTAWAVNSVCHLWGYRTYETPEGSRNNVIIGILASGEGWHNNHHADPRSARHGHTSSEFDLAWQSIRWLAALGLATDIRLPSPQLAAHFKSRNAVLADAGVDTRDPRSPPA